MNPSRVKDFNTKFVVVGAGAVGCGVAYTLAKAGYRHITVLEREDDVAKATTSQGAGLCGQVRNSADRVRLAMKSVETFRELQKDSVVQPEWREVGSLRIALTEEKKQEFLGLKEVCGQAGLVTEWLDPRQTVEKWPMINAEALVGSLWCPTDGYMTPYRVAKSYERQCMKLGVRFKMGVTVSSFLKENQRICGVSTSQGEIEADYVINAAGAHAYTLSLQAGLELPAVPVRHEYFVTAPMKGLDPEWPCFRAPEMSIYGRVSQEALLLGGWERVGQSYDPRKLDLTQPNPSIRSDWGVLLQFERDFAQLAPSVLGAQKSRVAKGWPTFTPDGQFIIGESTAAPGLIMAGGCNAHGISGSAGIGALLLESIVSDSPSDYVKSLSPDRFSGSPDWQDAIKKSRGIYENYYK